MHCRKKCLQTTKAEVLVKGTLEQLSKPRFFLRSSKIEGFSPLVRRTEEKSAIFKLPKKRGFDISSNISFPLIMSKYL